MHEYSVVQALMEQIESIAAQNDATLVSKVVVKIGVMSGIEPHLLEIAFNTFKERSVCDGAAFEMSIQPVIIACNQCHHKSELKEIAYHCDVCESTDVTVLDGEDMFLMSLEMQ